MGDGQKKKFQHSLYCWWKKSCSMWDSGTPVNAILHINHWTSGRISSINSMKHQHLERHLPPSHFLIFFLFGVVWNPKQFWKGFFTYGISRIAKKVRTETMKSKLGTEGKGSKLTKLVLFVVKFPARNNWLSLSEWQTATTAATTTGLLFHPIWSTYRWWFSEFNVEQSCQIMRVQVRVDSEMIHLDIVMLCFYVCTVLPKSQRCRNDNGCL